MPDSRHEARDAERVGGVKWSRITKYNSGANASAQTRNRIPAEPCIEAWSLALKGHRNMESKAVPALAQLARAQACDTEDQMIAVVRTADLTRHDAPSLAAWLARAKAAL